MTHIYFSQFFISAHFYEKVNSPWKPFSPRAHERSFPPLIFPLSTKLNPICVDCNDFPSERVEYRLVLIRLLFEAFHKNKEDASTAKLLGFMWMWMNMVGTSTVDGMLYEKPRPIVGNCYYGWDRLGSTLAHEDFIHPSPVDKQLLKLEPSWTPSFWTWSESSTERDNH